MTFHIKDEHWGKDIEIVPSRHYRLSSPKLTVRLSGMPETPSLAVRQGLTGNFTMIQGDDLDALLAALEHLIDTSDRPAEPGSYLLVDGQGDHWISVDGESFELGRPPCPGTGYTLDRIEGKWGVVA